MIRLIRSNLHRSLQSFVVLSFFAACLSVVFLGAVQAKAQQEILPAYVPRAIANSRLVRDVAPEARFNLAIGLPLRNQDELDLLLAQIADPASPSYRHFLTPEDFASRFGPTEADYQAVIAFAEQNGLVVTGKHSNRGVLSVSGGVREVEKAFNVKMKVYSHPVRGEFFAPDREPSTAVGTKILDISGLDNFAPPQPMSIRTQPLTAVKPNVTGSGLGGYFIGKDFRAAYAPGVTLTGSGQTVGLLEFDGFYAADVQKNFTQAGLPAVPTQTVLLDGFNGVPGGSNIEVTLDIMMAAYMAPGLTKIMVYEGEVPNDVLNRMATDNAAQQLSSSWGFGGVNATTEQIFKQFVAQGQSILQASGDSGAYWSGVMPPSDDPNLTVVGGTSLTTAGAGGPWSAESAWSGSGGGVSTVYAIPSYQQGTSMAANGGSVKMRNIPDVALTADIQIFLIFNNGQMSAIGGTSAAAPLWAGFVALANQQAATNAKPRVGFLNPLIYAIGNSSKFGTDLNDIRSGNNGYAAVTGYDLATGWGSPAGQKLIYDLSGTSGTPSFVISSSSAALSVKQSASGSAVVSVAQQNGFNSSVALAVSGLPAGVTAVFSPASTLTTSTLALTAGASAAAGTYPLTVTGTYGSLSSSTAIALTVVVPSFTLGVSTASLTVPRAGSASSSISVVGANGFSGTVALSAMGLPAGVTAAFSTASTSGTSTVTFSAGSTAATGVYPVTIAGVSGALKASAALSLTVTAPSFTLGVSTPSLTVVRVGSASSTISVVGANGFSGAVALSAVGLPAGVTAAFSAASASGISTVTFSAGSTAVTGVYPVTVTGVSGLLTASVALSITVVAPSFTLGVSAASLTVARSGSVSSTISVIGQNGFNSAVALSATGLPAGVTVAFSPASTTGTSIATFSASSTAVAGVSPVTLTGVSGTLKETATLSLTVTAPSFTLAFAPGTLAVPRGFTASGTATIVGQNGFNSSVALTVSGLPAGVTAAVSAVSASGTSAVSFSAGATTVAGTYPVTLTAVSGSLTKSAALSVVVIAPAVGTSLANLAAVYNVNGLDMDGTLFTGGLDGGLNGSPTAYSANLIGVQQTIGGTQFYFGPANALDAVSAKTIALPQGQFGSLKLLATGVNGNQLAQVFKVTYTDGTVTSFTQSLSDWFSPQSYSGETKAMTLSYRDNGQGQIDNRTFYLYEYTLALNTSKTVASVTLPNNRNVVVLAASVTGAPSVAK